MGSQCSGCLKQEFELRERLANGRPAVLMRFVSPFAAAGMRARLRGAEGCHGKFPELRSGIFNFFLMRCQSLPSMRCEHRGRPQLSKSAICRLQVNRLSTVARIRSGTALSAGCLNQEFELRERLVNGRPAMFMRVFFACCGGRNACPTPR